MASLQWIVQENASRQQGVAPLASTRNTRNGELPPDVSSPQEWQKRMLAGRSSPEPMISFIN